MRKLILLAVSVFLFGCSQNPIQNPVSTPPEISIDQLLSSPDTISVDSIHLYLATYMWRSFQPICPPDGTPLIAICYVTKTDSTQLPGGISADAVYIVYNNRVWKSWFTNESIPSFELKPNRIVKYVREGPKWGPQINVDVIVRVTDDRGHYQLLRASDQWINRVD